MAALPKAITVEAELVLRYSTGAETVLGAVTVQKGVHYKFDFIRTDEPLPATAITDSLARIQGAPEL